ncbi:hypothetical protein NPS38_15540, partial [Pseudomonas putida]|uniref:hypothetical protein n=1 Tax=Pseudomonas putida TaxID=303 RepID=UPI00236340BA
YTSCLLRDSAARKGWVISYTVVDTCRWLGAAGSPANTGAAGAMLRVKPLEVTVLTQEKRGMPLLACPVFIQLMRLRRP